MKKNDIRTLTRLALLVAIELVMKAVGLGSVPVGPLYMSFLTLPIAVGAITMGPAAGAILGGGVGAGGFRQRAERRRIAGQQRHNNARPGGGQCETAKGYHSNHPLGAFSLF